MKQIILFSLILIFSLNTFSQHNISVYKATYKTEYDDQYIKEYILVTVEDDNIYIVADHGETYITTENIRPDSRTINESTVKALYAGRWGYMLFSINEKIVVSDDYSKIALENHLVDNDNGFVIFEKTNLQYRFAHCSYSDIRNIRNEPHDEAEILGKADLSTANVQLLSICEPYIITDGIEESVKGQGCWYKAIIDGIEGYVWAEICFGEMDLVEK